jgi:hypothetical protein
MDAFAFPATWSTAKTIVKGGCISIGDAMCPSVTKYMHASGSMPSALSDARSAFRAAGFTETLVLSPDCEARTSGAACTVTATKGDLLADANIWPPGVDVDDQGVAQPDTLTIRVVIR